MPEQKWMADALGSEAFQRLASELRGSVLQSVLLEVLRQRARRRVPRELLRQYGADPFCAPALVDQRTALGIDLELLEAARAFEALELSPLAPLGTCSVVAVTDQNRVVSALRSCEVVSDPTNVLALECARRLRAEPGGVFHLATSQRVVRAQPVPKLPGHSQHFRLFVLASGGVEQKDHAFTADTVLLHIRTLLAGLERLEARGYAFGERRVVLKSSAARSSLGARIAQELAVPCELQPLEHGYYSGGLRYQIWVSSADGERLPLIDGGSFDWLAQLSSNRRAVFVASGAGSQLIPLRFQAPAAGGPGAGVARAG